MLLLIEALFVLSCLLGLVVMIYIHKQYPKGIDPSDDDSGDGGLPPGGDSVPVGPAPGITVHQPDEQPDTPRVSS
ncbi:MAG: hypothetical protein PPP56_02890 [Longimonas sp.]|uniref:hypothetical protein n=1 Tax=Longimonas sp. TaxID=2039626 RepID=UPI0033513338